MTAPAASHVARTIDARDFHFARQSLDGLEPRQRDTVRLLNLLNYTKTSGTQYAAEAFEAGYQTQTINGCTIPGQRQPAQRFERIAYDFSGATVLDIGCNQGGMLLEIADQIRHGVGIDFDHRMINAATALASHRAATNLDFFVFDLQRESLELIFDFLPTPRVDITFLLAVCKWIDNWKAVIAFSARVSETLLFESTGNAHHQQEQLAYLKTCYANVELLSDCSHDDPAHPRQMLLCREPR